MQVLPFERSLPSAIDSLRLEVSLALVITNDLLAGRPCDTMRLLEQAGRRLDNWHWHPEMEPILGRVREAGKDAGVLWVIALMFTPGESVSLRARDELEGIRGRLHALCRDLAEWRHALDAVPDPSSPPRARAHFAHAHTRAHARAFGAAGTSTPPEES